MSVYVFICNFATRFLKIRTMLLDIIFLVAGAVIILWGADRLTDGSSALARRLNVSETVIGLTVVAMGSSLPEFSVSLFSSIQGSGGMSAGNIVGSNLFNILVITGAVAVVKPISINATTIWKDIPLTILASLALFFLANDILLTGQSENILTRSDGAVMILFFLIFLSYTYSLSKNKPQENNKVKEEMPTWKILIFLLLGFSCLVGGGEMLVEAGTSLARTFGISETVIGLTILAGGTSLPEFAASLIAARKGSVGMAVGNVVGSCVFNIFFVLGVCSSVNPMQVGDIDIVQYTALVGSGLLMWIFCHSKRALERWEGGVMCFCYVAFITYLVLQAI